jgi:hypothetical protein
MGRHAFIAEFKCAKCANRFRACATASNGWMVACACGHSFLADGSAKADVPRSALTDNRVFTGTETLSRTWGFHPDEVGEVQRMMGAAGNCINADGDVNFGSRSEEKAFREKYKAVRSSNEAFQREYEGRAAEQGNSDDDS